MNQSGLRFRLSLLITLYMAEGLPSGLSTQALPAIMRSYGLSRHDISLAGFLMVPWGIKLLWAPWLDARYSLRLGQRRSWILPTQLIGAGLLALIACINPVQLRAGHGVVLLLALLFLLNLLAATHDIAVDGLATRLLRFEERGFGNSIQAGCFRLGLLMGGGLLLIGFDVLGWRATFLGLAGLLLLLLVPVLLLREPAPVTEPPGHRMPYARIFTSFLAAPGRLGWAAVLLVSKAGESLGSSMVKPMLVDMQFSLAQIGMMATVAGSLADLAGALLGGWLVGVLGRYKAILLSVGSQALAMGGYAWLAGQHAQGLPVSTTAVYGCVVLEHTMAGMSTVVLLTSIMDLTRPEHAGADFTLQTGLFNISSGVFYLIGGKVAEWLDYPAFFLFAGGLTVAMLVVPAILCRRLPGLDGRLTAASV